MVWGCISWKGVGRLHRVDGTMNADQYCRILEESYLGTLVDHALHRNITIFQHDNDPKHTSHKTKTWLNQNKVIVLDWPAQSPDMNIIEHVWDYLEKKLRARKVKPSNKEQLWHILEEEWENIPVHFIRDLYLNILRCVESLKKAKGSYTRY